MSSPKDTKLLPGSASSLKPQLEDSPDPPEDGEEPQPTPKLAIKANMVAQEVRVKVTGAHPGKGAGQRELFTEETSSVLIHENGGVILLSAAVAPGQLLFLANVESKREVVAQVKRKRAYRPTSCYVELEFAESAPRFWGMEFSAASALLPKHSKDAEAAELVISAEPSSDEPAELPPAPAGEEVQALKREVQAQGQPAPTAAITSESVPTEYTPAPVQFTPADQAQLPRPSLDFTVPKTRGRFRARGKFTPGFRGGVLRLAVLTAALIVTAVGAAWYKNWLPWKQPTKNPSVNTPATARTSLPAGSRNASKEHPEFANTKVAGDVPVTLPGLRSQPPASSAPSFPSTDSGVPPAVRETSPYAAPGKRGTVRPTPRAAADAVDSPAPDNAIVPPKLIKSVRALASLDALRDFETGNVVIDAVVGTAGEVHFLSVLSGPPSLRAPAVEAVKQYQYQPATRNGQPVPARVKIEIRFRFES